MNQSMNTSGSSPASTFGAARPNTRARTRSLARQFANEPELVLAYLESPDGGSPPETETIWAAARLAVGERPDYADLLYFAGHAALQADRPAQARGLLERALELNPRYVAALILAARAAMVQGESDEALEYLRRAVFNGADYADVHVMLGNLWRERDEVTRAKDAYRHALRINAELVSARANLVALNTAGSSGG